MLRYTHALSVMIKDQETIKILLFMAQYINKDALVAEITKRKEE